MFNSGVKILRAMRSAKFFAGLAVLFFLQACGGKVANLAGGSASISSMAFLSDTIYGLRVGEVATGVSTSGGIAPLTFKISTGALPEGVTLSETTGEIKGTIPTSESNKTYLVAIEVTDSAGLTITKSFTGTVDPGSSLLAWKTPTLSGFVAGVGYSFPLIVVGGEPPLTFSVYSGTLPAGITLNASTGLLSGTPTAGNSGSSYAFGIQVTDSSQQTVKSEMFLGTVAPNSAGAVSITNTAMNGVGVGAVSTGVSTVGGIPPLSFAVTAGTLPTGLTLDVLTGAITGTVPVAQANLSYAFSITVTDSGNTTDTQLYTGTVNAGSSGLVLQSHTLSQFIAGISYSYPLVATGGYQPYAFSVSSGTLPTGITLNSATGVISGTPSITTGGQSYNFVISVSDASSQVQTWNFTGSVGMNPAAAVNIISTSLPGIAVGSVTTGISTSGGVAPLTFAVNSGALPSGLSLNTSTGVISGTIPVSAANSGYAVAITVTDATGSVDINTFTGTVAAGSSVMSIASTSLSTFAAGISYSFPLVVTGGVSPFTYTISSGSLPTGVSINASTGLISGTPAITSGGSPFSFTVTVTDSASQTQSRAYSGSVIANPASSVSIVSTALPGMAVGAVSTGITTSGGVAPLTFAVASGALPTGLTLDTSTGSITGTIGVASAGSAYAVAITVTDASGSTASKSFTGTVAAGTSVLTMNSTSISTFTAGIAYSYPLVVTGGSTPYSFAISTGALPSGISINSSTGVISGTPVVTSGGTSFTFSVTVTDASSQSQTKSFVGTIASNTAATVSIVSTSLIGMTVGAVTSGVSTSGGIAPLVYAITAGSLPSGLSLNTSTGVITGTIPVSAANSAYAASISVTDAAGSSASRTFSGSVDAGNSALVLNSTTISPFTAGIAYSYPIVATNGVTPYGFSISTGTLPAGVTLNTSTGVISGTPTVATSGTTYGFTVTVTDAASQTKSQTFVGTVAASSASTLSITTSSIAAPTAGSYYAAGIAISGGTAPYSFAVSSGTIPSGLSISSSTGVISGTPAYATKGSAYSFTVTVTDASSLTTSALYSGTVGTYSTTLSPSSLAGATPGDAYTMYLSTSGGQSPYSYSITTGSLPTGLSLNASTGVISGTVADAESGLTKSFTIRSTDANNVQATTAYSIVTSSFPVTVSTASLTGATEGSAYSNSSTNLGATGGTGPYTYSYTGSLPSGVGLTSSGVFFGTPATGSGSISSGTNYTIYVTARDSTGARSAAQTLTLNVVVGAPVVDSNSPSNGVLGSVYSYTVTASGGRGPYTYAVTSGSLPTGLTLGSGGTISGTPTVASACPAGNFVVRATDSLSQISAASTKCIVTASGVSITNSSFPVVVIGTNYNMSVTATGGTSPYSFGATGLPSGLSINATSGLISGFTNASAGDYTVYLSVTDSASVSTYRSFSFSVRTALALSGATMPKGANGIVYCPQNATSCSTSTNGYQITASGGQTPYSYSITSGSLPPGLSMSTSGLISGTPGALAPAYGGSYTFNVVATDASGQSTSAATFTATMSTAPVILGSTLPIAVVGTPYAYDIKRAGGYNEFSGSSVATRLTYSVSGLATSGLNFNTSTGRIYGTPTTAGTYTLAVTVTDGNQITSPSKNLTLKVQAAANTLDLKAAHFSDPCSGTATCSPIANEISAITGNTQQFLVYKRTDNSTITIAKIDSQGRVPKAGSNNFTTSVAWPSNVSGVNYIRVADIDQDGNRDILFTDATARQLCVMWNSGTVNTYGMPSGFSATSYDCFPIPAGGHANNAPYSFTVRSDLRPDATNNGKQDVIVTSMWPANNASGMVYILNNTCAAGGSCTNTTTQRPAIFQGYSTTSTATLTNASTTAVLPFVAFPGMQLTGPGLAAGTTVASTTPAGGCTTAPCTVTLSAAANANATGSNTNKITYPAITAFSGPSFAASTTLTTGGNGSAFVGQLIFNSTVACATLNTGNRITALASGTTVTLSSACTVNASPGPTYAYGPVSHMPTLIVSGGRMRDANAIGVGWFISAKPTIPSGVTGVNNCPGIVVGGMDISNTNNSYAYVMRQSWTGSQCAGDFQTHLSSDESPALPNSWGAGVAVADFNNDGRSDISMVANAAMTSSAAIRVWLMAGGATFTSATQISPQLQSRGTTTVGGVNIAALCIDGSASCSYPSLAVSGFSTSSALSILPNSCSSPGCTTPFDPSTPVNRIDYPAPSGYAAGAAQLTNQNGELKFAPLVSTSNVTYASASASGTVITVPSTTSVSIGQAITGGNIPSFSYVTAISGTTITINQSVSGSPVTNVTIPIVPTTYDLAMAGLDNNGGAAPYFLVYPRNGTSSSDPFKGSTMLDSFPAIYGTTAEIGTMRLWDTTDDSKPDLFMFAPNQGFVGVYPSSSLGGVNYEVGGATTATAGPVPYYLAAPTANGCPTSTATQCYPDPIFNAMATQQGFPQTNNIYNDNTMDVGDINNDGYPDVAVNGYYSRGISVAMGSSTGTLGIPTLYQVGASADYRPQSLALSDLDQDGILDLVAVGVNLSVANTGFASFLKGNGDGTFQTAVQLPSTILGGCADPRVVQAVDIDLDGRPELAILCYTSQGVFISRRNNSGTWVAQSAPATNPSGGVGGVGMRIGRLTSSASTGLDIAIVGLDTNNTVRIIYNVTLSATNSAGVFTVSATQGNYIALQGNPSMVDIGDLNGDGYGDLVIPMRTTNSTTTGIQGLGAGVYYTCAATGTAGACSVAGWGLDGYMASSVTVGDVTNDGYPELFIGYGTNSNTRLLFRNISRILNTSY